MILFCLRAIFFLLSSLSLSQAKLESGSSGYMQARKKFSGPFSLAWGEDGEQQHNLKEEFALL